MPQQEHVVILVDRFDGMGGIQQWASQLANELAGRNLEVHLVGLSPPGEQHRVHYPRSPKIRTKYLSDNRTHVAHRGLPGYVRKTLSRLPRPVTTISDRILGGWRPESLDPTAITRLAEYLGSIRGRKYVIATTVVMLAHLQAAERFIHGRADIFVIAQYRNTSTYLTDRPRGLQYFRTLANKADCTVFLTAEDAALARSHGFTEATFIPNPSPRPNLARSFARSNVVVALGRLDRQKSFDALISAWSLVEQAHPEWRLRIYGYGPLKSSLRRQVRQLGLRSVEFHDVTQHPQLVLSEASIHVVSSQYEGWGLVVSEANAMGTPTVAFDNSPGVRAQVQNGRSGYLVPLNDIGRLGEALIDLIEDPEKRSVFGQASMQVAGRYRIERIADQWLHLFRGLKRAGAE